MTDLRIEDLQALQIEHLQAQVKLLRENLDFHLLLPENGELKACFEREFATLLDEQETEIAAAKAPHVPDMDEPYDRMVAGFWMTPKE